MSTMIAPPVANHFVPVEHYLKTMYHPDCDYLDGRVEERNGGEFEHGRTQHSLGMIFGAREREWSIIVVPECRLQVAKDHFRIPDLMVLRAGTKCSRIVREAPLVCLEVLSPEDTWQKMRERLNDYLAMGVEHIWCFDPEAREVRRFTADGFILVREPDLTIAGTAIRVNVSEVFSILDVEPGTPAGR